MVFPYSSKKWNEIIINTFFGSSDFFSSELNPSFSDINLLMASTTLSSSFEVLCSDECKIFDDLLHVSFSSWVVSVLELESSFSFEVSSFFEELLSKNWMNKKLRNSNFIKFHYFCIIILSLLYKILWKIPTHIFKKY